MNWNVVVYEWLHDVSLVFVCVSLYLVINYFNFVNLFILFFVSVLLLAIKNIRNDYFKYYWKSKR